MTLIRTLLATALLLAGRASHSGRSAIFAVAAEGSCKQLALQDGDTCMDIGRANNLTYAQLLSWNPTLDPICSNLGNLTDSKVCISNPLGSYPMPENTIGAITVAPVPTPVGEDTNTRCSAYHQYHKGDDCTNIVNRYSITLEDFLFLNPELAPECTNFVVGSYYCVQAVGNIETYPGYSDPTSTEPFNPVSMTTVSTSVGTPQPTGLPLANGTRNDCFDYLALNETANAPLANCWVLAMAVGVSREELVLWNPSLEESPGKTTSIDVGATTTTPPQYNYPCTISANSSYCVELVSPTPEPEQTAAPPSPRAAGEIEGCTGWYQANQWSSCPSVQVMGGITFDQLYKFNPAIGSDCRTLAIGTYYCISIWPNGDPPPDDDDDPTTTGVNTPSPIQTGMVGDCDKFYKVQSGDGCPAIAQSNGISLSKFYAWNPAVGSDCRTLQADVYVCVHTASQPDPTTTSGGNGITTPTPTQSGMVDDCDKFYKVQSGDGCSAIAQSHSVSLSNFYSWNPAVGSDCRTLQAGVYVCVHISGQAIPTTTTSAGNGITTPTPTASGMISSCDTFYKVKSGEGCAQVADDNNISSDDFYSWNPSVGSDCRGLLASTYYCVGILGTTTAKPTTTAPVETCHPGAPEPLQPGVTCDCTKWHLVASDTTTCDGIISYENIKAADFYEWNLGVGDDCSRLWAGYYVCVGV